MQQHEHGPVAVANRLELLKCSVLGRDNLALVGGLGDADIAGVIVPESAWESICHRFLAPPPHGVELPRPPFQVVVSVSDRTLP